MFEPVNAYEIFSGHDRMHDKFIKQLKKIHAILLSTAFLSVFFGLSLFVIFFNAPLSFAESHFTVAMITWRGETDAERGFIDCMRKSKFSIHFQKYHAEQDRIRLHGIITKIHNTPVDLIYVFGTTSTQIVLSRIKEKSLPFL